MAWQYLQAGVAGSCVVPIRLLCAEYCVSGRPGGGTQTVIWLRLTPSGDRKLTVSLYTIGLRRVFEAVIKYCATYTNLIPLSFVLGFYVSIVMTRWWSQYTSIPWPDPIAVFVSANVHGQVSQ